MPPATRVVVIGADKTKIPWMQTEMLRYPEKRLKLSSTLCKCDSPALQVREIPERRILAHQ